MYRVDLNSDLGESFGRYTLGSDDQIIPLITSANVACGFHASDPVVMKKTIEMAREAGIHVGAHPGYPDLRGCGRRNMTISPAEAKAYTLYQIGALDAFCKAAGLEMQHVKPHGAFYNMAAKDYKLAHGICEAIAEYNPKLILMALSGSEMIRLRRPRVRGGWYPREPREGRRDDHRRGRSHRPRRPHDQGAEGHRHHWKGHPAEGRLDLRTR